MSAPSTRCAVEPCPAVIPTRARFVPLAADRYLTTHEVDQDALRAHLLAEHAPVARPALRRVAAA